MEACLGWYSFCLANSAYRSFGALDFRGLEITCRPKQHYYKRIKIMAASPITVPANPKILIEEKGL